MGSLTPTDLARQMADIFEPMLHQVRREVLEMQEKFRASLGDLISSMVRAEIAETLARLGPAKQMSPAHTWVKGMTYMAGVLVAHRGGLWQAIDNTDKEPGEVVEWRILAEGIADISGFLDPDDPRLMTVVVKQSSGFVTNLETRLPLPLHKGTWQAEAEYLQGDEVSWEGSTWRARVTTKAQPPGPAWALVAKHGERGRAGKAGGGQ